MRSLSARKDGTALVIGAIPPNQNYFLVTANLEVYGLFQTPRVGLEPTTPRLTAACSTIELSRNLFILFTLEGHTLKTEPDDLPTMIFPDKVLDVLRRRTLTP